MIRSSSGLSDRHCPSDPDAPLVRITIHSTEYIYSVHAPVDHGDSQYYAWASVYRTQYIKYMHVCPNPKAANHGAGLVLYG